MDKLVCPCERVKRNLMVTYKDIKKRDKESFLKISPVERLDAMDHLFEEMLELQALYLGITKDDSPVETPKLVAAGFSLRKSLQSLL